MPIQRLSIWFASLLIGMAGASVASAEDAAPPAFTPEQLAFFETKIRPVLADNCYQCHSHEAEPLKGGFYLDSRAGILDAALAEPGDLKASLIIEAVHYKDPANQMPPAGKLPDAVIKDLERWVEMGLPWPDEALPGKAEVFDLEARRAAHWAWQAPKRSAPLPGVAGPVAGTNPIDLFLESRLAKEGLEPGPPADRATLIRRVTFDLTGLPPTPEEVDAFVNDPSPDAYEKRVDRLLDSPRFGEKWARHWLDLVRYAESYGHEFDYSIPHAWKYRDYVIRALNDDVPYDRFVKEHLAGDLIEPRLHPETKVNEAVKATGFWYLHEQTHAPTDVRQHESDRIDNQIDVVSKTFQAMTVACARCHDHKFDAISERDYYAMAGFLQSSRQHQAYLDPGGKIADAVTKVKQVVVQGQAAFEALGAEPLKPTTVEHKDSRLFEDFNAGDYAGWFTTGWAWGEKPTVPGQWDPTRGEAASTLPGVAHSGLLGDQAVGALRSPEFDFNERKVFVRVKGKGSLHLIIDGYTVYRFNRLLFEGIEANVDTKGKWQWVVLSPRRDFYAGNGNHRAHLLAIDDHKDAHLMIDEVRFGDAGAPPDLQTPLPASVSPSDDARFAALNDRFDAAAKSMPQPERVLAITDGTGEDSYVHRRGTWRSVGDTVPRRNLTALGGGDAPALGTDDGSGRRRYAEALVAPDNPLTARVQVNRLWHHLFGRGIVPTVDNFGYLGIEPSHRELLDHLAVVFVEDDAWSNKAMIKRIVMSRAYRRASDRTDPAAESKDPTNVLLHRQNIRRLDAEPIRDSILFVAGSLNEQRFGPPVGVHLTQFMQGRGRPKSGPLDGNGRRSIYTSVRRNFLSPMMLTFDAPIPFSTVGARNVTNVPAQALTLMNDPFVHDQANKWAKRLVNDQRATPEDRIDAMFQTALGRAPLPQERDAAVAFVNQQADALGVKQDNLMKDERPWRELCHAVFNLKGFIYVR
ncbi:MAG: PSD1 and planctomycete cytochrome C domain-containing protein [Phycisphaeraceae bacterium]